MSPTAKTADEKEAQRAYYSDRGSWAKAGKIVMACRKHGYDHEDAEAWDDDQWEIFAKIAKIASPPSERTINRVVNLLTPTGHEHPADPFERLT